MQMTDQDGAGLTAGTSVFKRTGGRADHRGSTAGCSASGPTTGPALIAPVRRRREGEGPSSGYSVDLCGKGPSWPLVPIAPFLSPRFLRASLGRNERLGGVGINNRMRKFACQ